MNQVKKPIDDLCRKHKLESSEPIRHQIYDSYYLRIECLDRKDTSTFRQALDTLAKKLNLEIAYKWPYMEITA